MDQDRCVAYRSAVVVMIKRIVREDSGALRCKYGRYSSDRLHLDRVIKGNFQLSFL
jgi:hypothetical protein